MSRRSEMARERWRRVRARQGHLYAVATADGQWVKVGYSTRVSERLADLARDDYYRAPGEVIGVVPSTFAAERALHARLRPFKQERTGPRELYRASPELLALVAAELRSAA